jgi:hypothetical protein
MEENEKLGLGKSVRSQRGSRAEAHSTLLFIVRGDAAAWSGWAQRQSTRKIGNVKIQVDGFDIERTGVVGNPGKLPYGIRRLIWSAATYIQRQTEHLLAVMRGAF